MMSQKMGDLRMETKESNCDWQSTKEASMKFHHHEKKYRR